jgi:hypothetical protein
MSWHWCQLVLYFTNCHIMFFLKSVVREVSWIHARGGLPSGSTPLFWADEPVAGLRRCRSQLGRRGVCARSTGVAFVDGFRPPASRCSTGRSRHPAHRHPSYRTSTPTVDRAAPGIQGANGTERHDGPLRTRGLGCEGHTRVPQCDSGKLATTMPR